MKINPKLKTVLFSYTYAVITALAVVWSHGKHDPASLGTAALSALLAPAVKFLNPADATLGIGAPKA